MELFTAGALKARFRGVRLGHMAAGTASRRLL